MREGGEGAVRQYVVTASDPARLGRLAELLQAQGIELRGAVSELRDGARRFPAGSLVVPLAQPAGRLARNLLERRVSMDAAFVEEQERRRRKRLPDQIYDVTGWSLPLLLDMECAATGPALAGETQPYRAPSTLGEVAPAKVGWLLPWGTAAAGAVAQLLAEDVKVQVAEAGFKVAGRSWPAGTAIVRVSGNATDTREKLSAAVRRHAAEAVAVDTGFVEEGVSFGSERVHRLQKPRVLLAWDRPVSSQSAGWTRWVLERRYGQAVSVVRVSSLRRVDLRRYDVLVLPPGEYDDAIGKALVLRIGHWVESGGTLVTLGDASRWLTREKVKLLATSTELKDGRPESEPKEGEDESEGTQESRKKDGEKPEAFDLEKAIQPKRERPDSVPGALLRVKLDTEHWLAAGTDGEIYGVVEGRRVFTPLKLDLGTNVGVYAPRDELVVSGLVWDEARDLLAQKAFLMHQPRGEGHVVAFAEDPNYRGYAEATALLFMNAVLLGPAY